MKFTVLNSSVVDLNEAGLDSKISREAKQSMRRTQDLKNEIEVQSLEELLEISRKLDRYISIGQFGRSQVAYLEV